MARLRALVLRRFKSYSRDGRSDDHTADDCRPVQRLLFSVVAVGRAREVVLRDVAFRAVIAV